MLDCLIKIVICSTLSFFACIIGSLLTFFLQGELMAKALFITWIKHFNGIIIAGLGWGVVWYGIRGGKRILNDLINLLEISEKNSLELLSLSNKATSWKFLSFVTLPVSILGAIILLGCGFPLHGFAKIFLSLGTISLYLAAAIGFGYVIYTLQMFKKLDDQYKNITIDRWAIISNFETLNSFFIITSTFAVAATYIAFRGTLSANFTYPSEFLKVCLMYPLILFMPALLVYSFYPRYVFRKIFDHDIYVKIEQLEKDIKGTHKDTLKDKLEMEKILAEVKEKTIFRAISQIHD